jgi:hypothetical protein
LKGDKIEKKSNFINHLKKQTVIKKRPNMKK